MSEDWLMELYRGPFEDLPPLAAEHEDDDPPAPVSQEAGSVRAAGTMDS